MTNGAPERAAPELDSDDLDNRAHTTSAVSPASRRYDSLDCFRLRVWAKSYLWRIGELTLPEAVDQLWADAERDGLVDQIGADAIQQIMAGHT